MKDISLDQNMKDSMKINFKEQSHLSNKPYLQLTKEDMYLNTKFFDGKTTNQNNLIDEFMNFDFEKQMTTKTEFTQFTQQNQQNETVSSIINQKEVYEDSEQESLWQDIFVDNKKQNTQPNIQFDVGQLQQQETSYISQSLQQDSIQDEQNILPEKYQNFVQDNEDVIVKQESFVVDDLEQIINELKKEQSKIDESQQLEQKEKIENFYSNFLSQHKKVSNLKEDQIKRNFVKEHKNVTQIIEEAQYLSTEKILDQIQNKFTKKIDNFEQSIKQKQLQPQKNFIDEQNILQDKDDQIRSQIRVQPEQVEKPKSLGRKFITEKIFEEEQRIQPPQQLMLTEDQPLNLLRKQKNRKIQIKTVKKDTKEIQNLKLQKEQLQKELNDLDIQIQKNEKEIVLMQIKSEKLLPLLVDNFNSNRFAQQSHQYPSEIMLQRPQTPSLFMDQNALQQYFSQDSLQGNNSPKKGELVLKNIFKNQNLAQKIKEKKDYKNQKETERKLDFQSKEKKQAKKNQKSLKKNDNFVTFSQKQLQKKCNQDIQKVEEIQQNDSDQSQQKNDSSEQSADDLYNFDKYYDMQSDYAQEKEVTIQKHTTKDIQFKAKYECRESSEEKEISESSENESEKSQKKALKVTKIKKKPEKKSPQKQDKIFEYIRKKIIEF